MLSHPWRFLSCVFCCCLSGAVLCAVPTSVDGAHIASAVVVAALVTAARFSLLQVLLTFRSQCSHRSLALCCVIGCCPDILSLGRAPLLRRSGRTLQLQPIAPTSRQVQSPPHFARLRSPESWFPSLAFAWQMHPRAALTVLCSVGVAGAGPLGSGRGCCPARDFRGGSLPRHPHTCNISRLVRICAPCAIATIREAQIPPPALPLCCLMGLWPNATPESHALCP